MVTSDFRPEVEMRPFRQGRINQYANNAMAWGPPVQGGGP